MNPMFQRGGRSFLELASILALAAGASLAAAQTEPLPSFSRVEAEGQMTRYEESATVKVGKPAPPFQVTTLGGQKIDLAELKGKVVYLHFFTTWCPWCKLEAPYLKTRVWEKYKGDKNFMMVWISREETEETVRQFSKEQGYPYPIALDPQRKIYAGYAADVVPREFIVDANGSVLYHDGEPDRKVIEECFASGKDRVGYDDLMKKRFDRMTALIDAALAKTRAGAAGSQ